MRPPRIAPALALIAATISIATPALSARAPAPAQEASDGQRRDVSALEKRVRSGLRHPDPEAAEAALEELRRVNPDSRSLPELQALVRARRIAFDERRAVVAFLGGDYELAATTLDRLRVAGPIPPRATFYLACSRAALAVTQIDSRDAELDTARALFLQATGTPGFAPNWRHISPAIRGALEGRSPGAVL